MKFLRKLLLNILRSSIENLIQVAMDEAVKELSAEIDRSTDFDKQGKDTFKAALAMLRSRIALIVREHF